MADNRNYETTYIVSPDLTTEEYTGIVEKFNNLLRNHNAEILSQEVWGFKKMAYEINRKMTGYYVFTEFIAPTDLISKLELEYQYDERVMRSLTVKLDKHAVTYNIRRRNRLKGIDDAEYRKKLEEEFNNVKTEVLED